SDPKKADERNFALRVINNLIDDYLLVYNEVASVTGKPSITREQVLNADLEISQRDVKDIITGMQEETRKRLEEQASQEDSELVVKLIKGKLEEEKNRITQQKTETPSSVDSLTSIKERYQKIQRLIKERDFYRLDCDSELDSLLNSLPPELRDLIGGSDNFLRLLKGETLESIIGYKKINNYLYGDNADKNSPKEGTIAGRIKNIEEQIISLENKIIEITSGGGNRNTQNESIKSLQSLITSKRSQLEELKKQLNLTDYILDLLKISRIQGKRDINLESLPSSYSNLINFLKTEALIIQEENLFYSLCNESNIEIVKTDENGNKKRKKIEDIIREIENKSPEKTEIIMSQFEALQIAWGSKSENAWEVQSKMQARLEEVMKGKELEYNEEVWKGLGGEGENHKKAMQLVYILFGEDYLIIPELSDEKRKKIEQIKSLFVDGEFFGGLKLSELQIENNSELIKQLIEAWKRNVFGLRKIGEQPSQKIEQQPDQNNQQQPGGKAGGAASSP
ncbi:MAG: hypothetical protein N2593_02695, partial [Patescibacteria group bacterium]|nr:hypothetical protein [Patescibacteria group bacterium]